MFDDMIADMESNKRLSPILTELFLTLIWLDSLGVVFKVGRVVPENIPFSTKALLILLMPVFCFAKNLHFFGKIVPLLKAIERELCQ